MTKTFETLVRGAALFAAAWLIGAGAAEAAIVTVTSPLDAAAADGVCTLREAIQNVNAGTNVWADCTATGTGYGNFDEIRFNIGGGIAVKTITPTSALPPITKTVTIDGYTQPGAAKATNLGGYPAFQPVNATIMVEIDCTALSNGASSCLTVATGGQNSAIQGLAMGNFAGSLSSGALVEMQEAGFVLGNVLGMRADGTTPWASRSAIGVKVLRGTQTQFTPMVGSGNPASSPWMRNVITACDVGVYGLGASGLTVQGNIIGLDRNGAVPLPGSSRGTTGILMDILASTAPYQPAIQHNVISGLLGIAVWLRGAYRPSVTSNLIGMNLATPQAVIGNGSSGIVIQDAGGLASVSGGYSGNTIAGSGGDGIVVLGSPADWPTGNGLTGNSIFQSAGLGINLQPNGEASSTVTPNDALDPDGGPNELQNFPVVTSAQVNGSGATVVQFTLNSAPSGQPYNTFSVSAYASPACSASGYGEGRYFGGNSGALTTDAAGNLSGSITVPAGTVGWTAGSVVTALAHDVFQNNTSEFSACVTIQGAVATPTKLAFVQQPTNAAAGAAIGPAVTVQLQDAGSSPVPQAGVSVTVALASGTGTLSGTLTQATNASGLATFSNLSVNLAGTKTLSAASSGLTGATSNTFVISAGTATSLTISGGNNQSAAVGTAFGAPLQVSLTDGQGNPVSGAQVTFTAPGSGASAALATSPATTDATGHAQVTATANTTTGNYTVTAASGTLPAVAFNLTNAAAPSQVNNVPALGEWGLAAFALVLSGLGAWLLGRIPG